MAGIYLHIPFCNKRCTYCDFYTEVAPHQIPKFVDSLIKEIEIRKDYLQSAQIQTIYFGGGTPSLLKYYQFSKIFQAIFAMFSVCESAEITFEANPDDLTTEYFDSIKTLPFNRISIGIQSFNDEDLICINRRHTAKQAIEAIQNAQKFGFKNISIDLIYGLPLQTLEKWEKQIDIALNMNIQHISAYGLTYEKGTALSNQLIKHEVNEVNEDVMNEMYLLLVNKLKQNGFEAYEISNFALRGFRSKHNSSYWNQDTYIGFGPSSHSFDFTSRQWNISNIKEYIRALELNEIFWEREVLTLNESYNDFIMVSLRKVEGFELSFIEQKFGSELAKYCIRNLRPFIDSKKVNISNGNVSLTSDGIMISNQILIQLMKV